MFGWPQIPKPANPPEDPPQLDFDDRLLAWRYGELLRAGIPAFDAMEIANTRVDYYEAVRLVEGGCPPDRVADILL